MCIILTLFLTFLTFKQPFSQFYSLFFSLGCRESGKANIPSDSIFGINLISHLIPGISMSITTINYRNAITPQLSDYLLLLPSSLHYPNCLIILSRKEDVSLKISEVEEDTKKFCFFFTCV